MFNNKFIQNTQAFVLWALVSLVFGAVLGACSSLRKEPQDGPPTVAEHASENQAANQTPNQIPNQVPRVEPLSKYGNPKSYVVFGKTYYTLPSSQGFVQRGIASWYGKKFHGRLTSSREPYDMYAMTAAHPQLPLPTYVQVTNLKNGKQVILRVNDRGPFHGNRVIDLSYTAAMKLDIVKQGTGLVEVRALDPRNYRLAKPPERQLEGQAENQSVMRESMPRENGQEEMNQEKVSQDVAQETVIAVSTENSNATVIDATTTLASDPQVYIQVGAFGDRANADQLKNQLNGLNIGSVSISSVVKDAKPLHRVRIGPLANVKSADDTVGELNAMGMSGHRVVIE